MPTRLRILLIFVLIVYLFIILKSVKRKNIRISYLIYWLITGVTLVIALLVPSLVEKISNYIGFGLPINMIFSGAIFVILFLIFDLTKIITKEQNKNVTLIQEVSILKKRVGELEKSINNESTRGDKNEEL